MCFIETIECTLREHSIIMNTKNPGKAYAFPGRNLLVSRGTTRIEK